MIQYSLVLHLIANDLSKLRTKLSKDIYNIKTDKYRGDQEKRISFYGILGELIIWEYLTDRQINFKPAPLVDLKPSVGADIFLEKYKIDIKTIPPEKNQLHVNKSAHDNISKDITHYTFVNIIGAGTAELLTIPKNEVDQWDIIKSKYTEVYKKDINCTV